WDSTRSIAVLSNDVDIDGDPLQIIGVSDPESGSVSTDGETVSYTPVPGVLGTVTFAYIISDGNGDTASAGVSLTVTAVNQVPLAESDTANTTEDTNTTIDVLSNDSDPDGDTLTIAAVVPGSGGTTFTNGDRITYRPAVNFTGQDSFTYTISDERGGVASASVSVTVSPSNDPPEAVPDIAITDEDTGVWIRALTNDWDPDSTELAILSVTDGQHGGSILENDRIRYFPHDNYFGQDNFTYSMSDGDGAETTGTVSITIVGVNDMPNAGDDSASLNEDTQVVIDVLVNDEDVDGDSLRVATVTQGTNGSVDIEDNSIRYTPARDFNGTDSFTYSISDPGGLMDSAIVSLVIHPVDEGPSADGVRITFPEITREGNTDIRTQTCLTRPESGFTFLTIDNPRCIWVDTEVEFTGNATVCIDYREAVTPLPLDTVMIRCDDGHCVPLPTRVNYDTEAVCGDTPSLSMFVLGNALDSDGDGTQDFVDACPWTHEQAQQDSDGDRIGDACDRCPTVSDYTNICGGTGLELHSGFNLIGIPIDAGNPELSAFGLLRAIGDETLVSHIQQFNPTTGTFEKAYYEGDLLQGIDFQIKSGSGYQLFMKQPIKGLRELNKGYNLIGAPNTRGQIGVTAFLLLTSIGDETILSSIQRLNPASGRIESASYFNGRPVGVDFPINAKTGYILYRR
ncbi:MAG: tandem-95 repeat protein, partial [Gammaproteobacteria bacterium]|nr:tandem-95 repeat protein [Gammaproteobacteria bacterium]